MPAKAWLLSQYVAIGGTVVVAPVEGHGGLLAAQVNLLQVRIGGFVRMTCRQVILQSPFPSQFALDVVYLGVG